MCFLGFTYTALDLLYRRDGWPKMKKLLLQIALGALALGLGGLGHDAQAAARKANRATAAKPAKVQRAAPVADEGGGALAVLHGIQRRPLRPRPHRLPPPWSRLRPWSPSAA